MGIWAAVKYALNSTLGTSGFLSLDKMIQAHGTQTFTANGTFTVPAGVTKILITAFGAGGSGYLNSGGQGGNFIIKKPFQVTPGQKISITVGKGSTDANGGSTVIGNLVTLEGGVKGGETSTHKGAMGGSSSTGESQRTVFAYGGIKGVNNNGTGGYGGGAGYERGGEGGFGARSSSYFSGDGENGGIGAGGGAGGYGGKGIGANGVGGDGIVIIEW